MPLSNPPSIDPKKVMVFSPCASEKVSLPIDVTFAGIVIASSAVEANAQLPIVSGKLLGEANVTVPRRALPSKAPEPIDVTLAGIVIAASEAALLNAESPIVKSELGVANVTVFSAFDDWKADLPIDVTVVGIVMDLSESPALNAESAIVNGKLLGEANVTVPRLSMYANA